MDRTGGTWELVGSTAEKHMTKVFIEALSEGEPELDLYRLYLSSCKNIF